MSKVEIFIPVFNGSSFITTAIHSVVEQSYPHVKAVVVDNASTDETVAIVKEMQAKWGGAKIQLVRNEKNIGLFGNLNKCLSLADADYFAILCADDYYCDPRAVEKCVRVMEQDPSVAAVFGDNRIVDVNGMDLASIEFMRSGKYDPLSIMRESIMKVRNRFGISALMRRTKHEATYSEDLSYSADVEFAYQHAESRSVYYMSDGPLIANRYHLHNGSRAAHWSARSELWRVGKRNGVSLSAWERVRSIACALVVGSSKVLFFHWVSFRQRFGDDPKRDVVPWSET